MFLSVDPVTAYDSPIDQFHRYRYANNNPYTLVDPDGRAAGLLSKAIKLALKGGDVAATFAGAIEDGRTLFSRDATLGQRAMALGSLATEVVSPVSARDVKAGVNAIQGADKKAAQIAERIGGNSVTVGTSNGHTRYDVAGDAHYSKAEGRDLPTPHATDYKENVIPSGPRAGEVGSVSQVGEVRPVSSGELRAVERALDNRQKVP